MPPFRRQFHGPGDGGEQVGVRQRVVHWDGHGHRGLRRGLLRLGWTMVWLEAASWGSAGILLVGLVLLRRHWDRLPALQTHPAPLEDPPSVCR